MVCHGQCRRKLTAIMEVENKAREVKAGHGSLPWHFSHPNPLSSFFDCRTVVTGAWDGRGLIDCYSLVVREASMKAVQIHTQLH